MFKRWFKYLRFDEGKQTINFSLAALSWLLTSTGIQEKYLQSNWWISKSNKWWKIQCHTWIKEIVYQKGRLTNIQLWYNRDWNSGFPSGFPHSQSQLNYAGSLTCLRAIPFKILSFMTNNKFYNTNVIIIHIKFHCIYHIYKYYCMYC